MHTVAWGRPSVYINRGFDCTVLGPDLYDVVRLYFHPTCILAAEVYPCIPDHGGYGVGCSLKPRKVGQLSVQHGVGLVDDEIHALLMGGILKYGSIDFCGEGLGGQPSCWIWSFGRTKRHAGAARSKRPRSCHQG